MKNNPALERRLFVVYAKPFRECVSIFPSTLNPSTQRCKTRETSASSIGSSVAQIENACRTLRRWRSSRYWTFITVIFQPRILARERSSGSRTATTFEKIRPFGKMQCNGCMSSVFQKKWPDSSLICMFAVATVFTLSPVVVRRKRKPCRKTLADTTSIPAANMNPVIFAGDKTGTKYESTVPQEEHAHLLTAIRISIRRGPYCGIRGIRILRG